MPCRHCLDKTSDALAHLLPDADFPLRTMGACGPPFAPLGHGRGKVCRVCGVLFFPPQLKEAKDG